MTKIDCCNGCKERWTDCDTGKNCHATCERYIAQRNKREADRREMLAKKYTQIREYKHSCQYKINRSLTEDGRAKTYYGSV